MSPHRFTLPVHQGLKQWDGAAVGGIRSVTVVTTQCPQVAPANASGAGDGGLPEYCAHRTPNSASRVRATSA